MARKLIITTSRSKTITLRVSDKVGEEFLASLCPIPLLITDIEAYLLSRYNVYHYPIWLTYYQCRRILRELDRYEIITKITIV